MSFSVSLRLFYKLSIALLFAFLCERSSCINIKGYVLSREFKRNDNWFYDVELHSDGNIYVPKTGKIQPVELIKTNTSLYPFTTSSLIIRLYDDIENRAFQVYFNSNLLSYPLLMYPGAKVHFNDVSMFRSKSDSTYYKLQKTSVLEIIAPPSLDFHVLSLLLNDINEQRVSSAGKRDLISFVHGEYKQHLKKDGKPTREEEGCSMECNITARVTLVQSIIVYSSCSICYKDVQKDGCCELKCLSSNTFHIIVR